MVNKQIILVGLLILIIPNVYAQQTANQPCGTTTFECYQESGFRLMSDPIICMDLPSDRNVVSLMRAYTQDAVMNWQSKINSVGMSWNIQLLPDTTSNTCNITIQYLPHPSSSENLPPDVTGETKLNIDNTASIEIFYNDVSQDDQGSYYFLDSLGPDYQLHWTIEHEIGHAFGLGHYITKNGQAEWSTGTKIPSIMLPIVPLPFTVPNDAGVITPHPTITVGDAAQLKSLYPSGFSGQAFQQTSASIPTTNMAPSDISYWKYAAVAYFSNSTNNIGSTDYNVNVLNLVDVFDSEQLISIPDPVGNQTNVGFWLHMPYWLANDISWWSTGQITDEDLAAVMQYMHETGLFYFQKA